MFQKRAAQHFASIFHRILHKSIEFCGSKSPKDRYVLQWDGRFVRDGYSIRLALLVRRRRATGRLSTTQRQGDRGSMNSAQRSILHGISTVYTTGIFLNIMLYGSTEL